MDIPRSTYYYKARRKSSGDLKKEADMLERIDTIACEYPRYGYRRITKQLHREGMRINHKKVLRLMRENSLLCSVKRSWVETTDSRHTFRRYPNLIKDKRANHPNQIWVSDITYIRIETGFVYLAVLLDLYSRRVVGYGISRRLNGQLVIHALKSAIASRRPLKGCIHHSDQGVQYACNEYIHILKAKEFIISMSGKGNPYDNAHVESFFKTLKHEEVHMNDYRTFDDVAYNIPFFIEEVYNAKRLHSSLGYVPPDEFEASYFNLHTFGRSSSLENYKSV